MFCTDKKNKFDEEVDEMGVRILIDPGALMHVVGTKMDFVEDRLKYALSHVSSRRTNRTSSRV